jgi:biotin transporter BioY
VIKQFNFYDVYGYLLPGVLLLAILWLPFGIFAKAWPEQDLSKAIFVGVIAYILGLLVQSVAAAIIPSTVEDEASNQRFLSEFVLDSGNHSFSADFKARLELQVQKIFGLALQVTKDGDGEGAITLARQAAFFQARAYLISKKAASYAEQFEGLYVMMRGLGCSFCIGAAYLAGWCLSVKWLSCCLAWPIAVVTALLVAGILRIVWQDHRAKSKPTANTPEQKQAIKAKQKQAIKIARFLWLGLFCVGGFWSRYALPDGSDKAMVAHPEFVLLGTAVLTLIAAAKCFTSYRGFAEDFAKTVWRDFSASISFGGQAPANGPAEEEV